MSTKTEKTKLKRPTRVGSNRLLSGVELGMAERRRQIAKEGWTTEHDDQHRSSELAIAGHCYELCHFSTTPVHPTWPWSKVWWKPKGRQRNLERAWALYEAEIDRLKRRQTLIAKELDTIQKHKAR